MCVCVCCSGRQTRGVVNQSTQAPTKIITHCAFSNIAVLFPVTSLIRITLLQRIAWQNRVARNNSASAAASTATRTMHSLQGQMLGRRSDVRAIKEVKGTKRVLRTSSPVQV